MIDSQDIALKIKAGDEHAFEQVFRSHYAGMCGYAGRYILDKDEAEEIVQEVFFNYWNKKGSLDIVGSIEAYLYRAVRNACLNHLKHLQVRSQYALAQTKPLGEEATSLSDEVVVLELQEKIVDCIAQLPPERQKIFRLSREEGLKYREIADQLGLSVKTVETQMGKALQFLRTHLAEYLPALGIVSLMQAVVYWFIHYF